MGVAPNDRLLGLIDHLAMVQEKMRWAPNKKLHFEMGAVKAVQILQEVSLTDVVNFLRDAAEGMEPPALPVAVAPKPDGAAAPVAGNTTASGTPATDAGSPTGRRLPCPANHRACGKAKAREKLATPAVPEPKPGLRQSPNQSPPPSRSPCPRRMSP